MSSTGKPFFDASAQGRHSDSHRSIRLLGMSLKRRYRPSANHTGPSAHRVPVYKRSTAALTTLYFANRGSTTSTAGLGYPNGLFRSCSSASARGPTISILDSSLRKFAMSGVSFLEWKTLFQVPLWLQTKKKPSAVELADGCKAG